MVPRVAKVWIRRGVAWLRERDLTFVAALVVIGALLLVFFEIAEEVGERETQSFDESILLALRAAPDDPLGPPALENAVMHLSALGSGVVTGLIVVLVTGFFLLAGRRRYAALMVACSVGTGLAMWLLKDLFERPRPMIVTQIDPPGGLSFPSGHSMIAAALYMTLAVLIARNLESRRLQIYVVAAGASVALLIGATRVYLGVHYPTDVLAGWTLGLTWALICGLVAHHLGKRGVEGGPPPASACTPPRADRS